MALVDTSGTSAQPEYGMFRGGVTKYWREGIRYFKGEGDERK